MSLESIGPDEYKDLSRRVSGYITREDFLHGMIEGKKPSSERPSTPPKFPREVLETLSGVDASHRQKRAAASREILNKNQAETERNQRLTALIFNTNLNPGELMLGVQELESFCEENQVNLWEALSHQTEYLNNLASKKRYFQILAITENLFSQNAVEVLKQSSNEDRTILEKEFYEDIDIRILTASLRTLNIDHPQYREGSFDYLIDLLIKRNDLISILDQFCSLAYTEKPDPINIISILAPCLEKATLPDDKAFQYRQAICNLELDCSTGTKVFQQCREQFEKMFQYSSQRTEEFLKENYTNDQEDLRRKERALNIHLNLVFSAYQKSEAQEILLDKYQGILSSLKDQQLRQKLIHNYFRAFAPKGQDSLKVQALKRILIQEASYHRPSYLDSILRYKPGQHESAGVSVSSESRNTVELLEWIMSTFPDLENLLDTIDRNYRVREEGAFVNAVSDLISKLGLTRILRWSLYSDNEVLKNNASVLALYIPKERLEEIANGEYKFGWRDSDAAKVLAELCKEFLEALKEARKKAGL